MNKDISEIIDNEYKDYSKYVLYSRAIPNIIDGLKPSQRKILYTATKVCRNNRIKTASLSGNVISMAEYHHGDASLNDAIPKMIQTFNNNLPLLLGEGSFGTRLVPEPAAARYTFSRLSSNFEKYFLDNDITSPSYNVGDPEPNFYLPIIPWVLVNGISGIAVGFATNILPRNPKTLSKICAKYIQGKNIDNIKIPPYFKDFEGDIILEDDGRYSINGVFLLKGNTLNISEVPIGFDREKYVTILDSLVEDNKIVRYKDKCNKKGFNFDITLKNGHNLSDESISKLFKLKKVLNENITVIDESGNLKVFDNPNDVIKHFCDYRLARYKDRYNHYINRDTERRELLKEKVLFIESVLNGDTVIKNKNRRVLRDELETKGWVHIDSLLSMNIYHLCSDEIDKLKDEIKKLNKNIQTWSTTDIHDAFIEDLKNV